MNAPERWLSPLLRTVGRVISPAGARARLSVLIFHRVLDAPDPMRPGEIDAAAFRFVVDLLSRQFEVLPLGSAVQRLVRGELDERAVAITFDDGYADNARVALPILADAHVPATFFVSTGFLDGSAMWNDVVIEAVRETGAQELDLERFRVGRCALGGTAERADLAQRLLQALKHRPLGERRELVSELCEVMRVAPYRGLMMTADDVRTLARAGMAIGAHTVNHPILRSIPVDEAEHEVITSKKQLEAIVGGAIELFAYPNGRPEDDYAIEHVRMVERAGFVAAVTTAWGVATRRSDVFQLPRFTPWDRDPLRFGLRMLQNYTRTHPKVAA